MTTFVECTSESGDSESELTGCVLVVRDKLDQTRLVRLKRLTGRSDHFEVGSEGGFGGEGTDLPSGCLTNTDFGLANT